MLKESWIWNSKLDPQHHMVTQALTSVALIAQDTQKLHEDLQWAKHRLVVSIHILEPLGRALLKIKIEYSIKIPIKHIHA